MYLRFLSLVTLAFTLALPAHAGDTPAAPPTPPPTQTQVAPAAPAAQPISYKDQFLQLALDKAKLYSGKAEDAIGKGVDIAMEEAKPTAIEFLKWRTWLHALKAFTPPFFLILFVALQLWQWPRFEFNHAEHLIRGTGLNVVASIVAWVGMGVTAGLTLTISIPNLLNLIQITVAPRIYVIEQVIEIAKR